MPVTSPLRAKPLTSLRMTFSYAFLPLPVRTENVTWRQSRPGDVEASGTTFGFSIATSRACCSATGRVDWVAKGKHVLWAWGESRRGCIFEDDSRCRKSKRNTIGQDVLWRGYIYHAVVNVCTSKNRASSYEVYRRGDFSHLGGIKWGFVYCLLCRWFDCIGCREVKAPDDPTSNRIPCKGNAT
jgi:hypothetical protein